MIFIGHKERLVTEVEAGEQVIQVAGVGHWHDLVGISMQYERMPKSRGRTRPKESCRYIAAKCTVFTDVTGASHHGLPLVIRHAFGVPMNLLYSWQLES